MATATFAEEVKDKTQEELVEACFKVHLELRILVARKTGGQEPQRVAFATAKLKQKLENKAREEIISLYLQACKKIDDLNKAEDSGGQQKRRKTNAELPDFGVVHVLGDIVKASLGPLPNVCQEQVLLDLERARMANEDNLNRKNAHCWECHRDTQEEDDAHLFWLETGGS